MLEEPDRFKPKILQGIRKTRRAADANPKQHRPPPQGSGLHSCAERLSYFLPQAFLQLHGAGMSSTPVNFAGYPVISTVEVS